MFSKAYSLILCCLLALTSTLVSANNFNYNSVEFRVGADPTTFGVAGSLQFMENAHYIARFDSKFEGDWDLAGGIGFNGPVNQFVDIFGQMLLHNIKEDSGDLYGEDFVPELNIGTRMWLVEGIELYGKMGQLIDSNDTHFIWELGGRFHSTDQLVLGASLLNNGLYGGQFMMFSRFKF